jgi:thiol-disulfide isomerase/thioredoxin
MQPIPRRILLVGILLLGLTWTWFSRLGTAETTAGRVPAPQTGFQAPDFTLETIEGQTVTLSNLRGQPVIINFWASWCPPCRAEMPAFQAIYEEYQGRISLLSVNTAYQDNLNDALALLVEKGATFPVLLDADGAVSRLYAIISLPTTFFIGADGVIAEVVVGGPMTEAGLRARIESLLEARP